jgi:purine nucleosidase
MRTFLIDTDTASDDAVALIMALQHASIRVAAITVVAGNVPQPQATRNALYTVELCGADVPVYAGASKPLLRKAEHAEWFHGTDGLGNNDYPPPKSSCRSEHASDAIIAAAESEPGLTLVTLGPLTNIAIALSRAPGIAKKIARCVIMGGNPCCEGNVTPAAEYNIWVDPEAAQIVLGSGMNIELVGWQLCRGAAALNVDDIAAVRALDNRLAHFAIDCNRVAMEAYEAQTGEIGIALPDPIAMAIALDPSICMQSSAHRVEAECSSELTRGMTVVDKLNVSKDDRNRGIWSGRDGADIHVRWSMDVPRWKQLLLRALRENA